MKHCVFSILLGFAVNVAFGQNGIASVDNNFVGIAKYRLFVTGSEDKNTDSMTIIFDKDRVMVIMYLPDSNLVAEKIFIDDFNEKKSMKVYKTRQAYEVDTLKTQNNYEFVNDYSIGAVNNELCLRYKAKNIGSGTSPAPAAECLAGINFRTVAVKDYFFLGIQPVVIDNRLVMDYIVNQPNGTQARVLLSEIKHLDNVDKFFDLWGYREIK